jgi:hypothetical protein
MVDTFIEKPFSVLTLSCIAAPHLVAGANQNDANLLEQHGYDYTTREKPPEN